MFTFNNLDLNIFCNIVMYMQDVLHVLSTT